MALQAIRYERGKLQLLDQRLLPFENTYLDVLDPKAAWTQIKDMVVRGAPAIGVTGALSLAQDLWTNKSQGSAFSSPAEASAYVAATMDYLVTSRPTAVNLADSANKLKMIADTASKAANATPQSVVLAVIVAAESFYDEDIAANRAMGQFGSAALISAVASSKGSQGVQGGKLRVLTHCNTGSLATAGFGTALGVIRALHEQGKLEHAFCTETRPYNQGARLTAFELLYDGLPSTLICDSAAASLMASGQVDAIVVGADRVVANGDTANKIGTYSLSITAAYHKVPFFIAAPTTTLDPNLPDGSHIVIEQRPSEEITHFKGTRVVKEGVKVWNPSFDVAPASLIAGIITEKGMVPKSVAHPSEYDVKGFMQKLGLAPGSSPDGPAPSSLMKGFMALNLETIKDYVASLPALQQQVGPASTAHSWEVKEVGDGNINFVYIVTGPDGSICIKQSLPFVRCVGESWPLTMDRARIEVLGLIEAKKYAPDHVPTVYHFDLKNAIIAMQYLAPPFLILRKGMIQGQVYPKLADHVSEFLAQTLFHTSTLKLSTEAYRANVARFTNNELCRLTEQVIFSEPYFAASNNHYNPLIDKEVKALQSDPEAKAAVSFLKDAFTHRAEALLHGDLHTGSIMVTPAESSVIDPEFGFYGPMAFDVAKILGNLLLSFFATFGLEKNAGDSDRSKQRDWILGTIESIWDQFVSKFKSLWAAHGHEGDLYPASIYGLSVDGGKAATEAAQAKFFDDMWQLSLGFMGSFLIRRVVGIAHVADMDTITDEAVRGECEKKALLFGRRLLVKGAKELATVKSLVEAASSF